MLVLIRYSISSLDSPAEMAWIVSAERLYELERLSLFEPFLRGLVVDR